MRSNIKMLFVAVVLLPLFYLAFHKACTDRPIINTNDDAVTAQRHETSSNSNAQSAVAEANEQAPGSALAPAAAPAGSAPNAERTTATEVANRKEARSSRARQARADLLVPMGAPTPLPRVETARGATAANTGANAPEVRIAAITTLSDMATAGSRAGSSGVPPTVQYRPDFYRAMAPPGVGVSSSDGSSANTQQQARGMDIAGGAPSRNKFVLDSARAPASAACLKCGAESAAASRESSERENLEIEKLNAILSRTSKEANAALAIQKSEAALVDDPGQYALLLNKALVLDIRGLQRYNTALTATDKAARDSGLQAARRDFTSAVELTARALQMMKAQPPSNEVEKARYDADKLLAFAVRAQAMRLYVSKVDRSQIDAAHTAFADYIAAETDTAKKSTAQHELARMLLDAGAFEDALSEYREILAKTPDDLDAIGNSGIAWFNLGAAEESKGKPEAARRYYLFAEAYLNRFLEKAPQTNELKSSAIAALAELKHKSGADAARAGSAGAPTNPASAPAMRAAPPPPQPPPPPPKKP